MGDRFIAFLLTARWASAVVALMYHVRYLLFVNYDAVHAKTGLSKAFYFLTGLGHESFAVFVILDGVVGGLILLRHRAGAVLGRAAVSQYLGSLYRILLPGLILGAGFDLAGVRFFNHSGLYTAFPEFSTLTLSYASLLGNLFMLQPFVVPTFGSNGMLYLLSYLFWYFILLLLFVRAARLAQPRRRQARALLLAAVILIMPYEFLFWGAIWLSGVAVVVLGEARVLKPPVLLALGCFAGILVLSRLIGYDTSLLPQPFGDWLVHAKYLLVGMGFAAVARALYPDQAEGRDGSLLSAVVGTADGRAGQAASFTFFCHFPVIMLLVATVTALLDRPLMQQPTPAAYGEFACLVGACLITIAVIARAAAAAMDAVAAGR